MKPKILVSSSAAADVTLAAAAAASLFSVLVLVEVVRASARNALASGCVVPGSSVTDSVSSAVMSVVTSSAMSVVMSSAGSSARAVVIGLIVKASLLVVSDVIVEGKSVEMEYRVVAERVLIESMVVTATRGSDKLSELAVVSWSESAVVADRPSEFVEPVTKLVLLK